MGVGNATTALVALSRPVALPSAPAIAGGEWLQDWARAPWRLSLDSLPETRSATTPTPALSRDSRGGSARPVLVAYDLSVCIL